MKAILLFAVITFSSCKTATYYESADNFTYTRGTLYLVNGERLEGRLTINRSLTSSVKIYLPGEKKAQYHPLREVEGCMIHDQFYELKKINDGSAFNRSARFHFMKRLTPYKTGIILYEFLAVAPSMTNDPERGTVPLLQTKYYVQLPSEKENGVWDICKSKLVPNFDKKMSKIVRDCPDLSQKIANKEKGYFYPQIGGSDEKRLDVWWTIIIEYNRCK